jgi:hypothetical protein
MYIRTGQEGNHSIVSLTFCPILKIRDSGRREEEGEKAGNGENVKLTQQSNKKTV